MRDGHVHADRDRLSEFARSIDRFSRLSVETLRTVRSTITAVTDELERGCEELRQELRLIAESDSGTEALHDEAHEGLSRARYRQRELDVAVRRYQREAGALEQLAVVIAPRACAHLRALSDDIVAYRAASPVELVEPSRSGPVVDVRSQQESAPFDPTMFRLPEGFRWVAIEQIGAAELDGLGDSASYRKASPEVIRRGLDALRAGILPAMNEQQLGSDDFANQDAARGMTYEQGDQCVYDAFFGEEPIHLDRASAAEPYLVIDGRHRIVTARDAGWKAVPATTTDERFS